MTARLRTGGILLCIAALAFACTRETAGPAGAAAPLPSPALAVDPRPNIVLVTLCSFRRSRLGIEGYRREITPYLDALADRGVYFENAVASSSWTKPTTASLLTGVTPGVHQMTDYYDTAAMRDGSVGPVRVLADEFQTLPEALRDAGYRTMCRVNNPHAGSVFRLTQGCEDASLDETQTTSQMIADFATWLGRSDRARPFFLFLMTLQAHAPYQPTPQSYARFSRWSPGPVSPDGLREHARETFDRVWKAEREDGGRVPEDLRQEWNDLYDATVADLDAALSELDDVLANAGVASNTVIVVTADHGEEFWEHGQIEHGLILAETLVGVPLIFTGPGFPAGSRVSEVVRTIDVYPTLAELAGARVPDIVQGERLQPLILPPEPPDEPPAGRSALSLLPWYRAVRLGAHKLVAGPERWTVYDVENDPLERHDIALERPEVFARLQTALADWEADERRRRALVPDAPTVDLAQGTTQRLRALGYLE